MFQSLKFINCTPHAKDFFYKFNYKITDSDFVSYSFIIGKSSWHAAGVCPAEEIGVLIKEYENRNYSHKEIVSNLFLLNMFLLNFYIYKDLNEILYYQHKYLTTEYYPEINFNKYYNDLVKYTRKLVVIS